MGHLQATTERKAAAGDLHDRLFSFADLSQYSLRQRMVIRLTGVVLYWLIRVIGATVRYHVIGKESQVETGPVIYCFWHNRIPIATHFWRRRGIVVMSSQSFDSEYIARFIQRFGYGAARGSSTRGARSALIQMIRAVRSGQSAAFTVDGPRGPIYEAKPGAILLAAKSGAAILPFSISLDRYWRLPSWDGIQIPKPFARATVILGKSFRVADSGEPEESEKRELLQNSLIALGEESDRAVAS